MRKIEEVLRLHHECGRSDREIAQAVRASPTTVGDYLRRARLAGLAWPPPDGMSEAALEAALFPPLPAAAVKRAEPIWAAVHRQVGRSGVTLDLLWQEYRECHPDGYQYSGFCEHYRAFARALPVTLRQSHAVLAGENGVALYLDLNIEIAWGTALIAGLALASKADAVSGIEVERHPIFTREDNHLFCEVPIGFVTAALGGEMQVPTLDGKVMLKIPPGTQTGKMFRVRGKGVKPIRGGIIGDLICRVLVETPVNLTERQKELLREFDESVVAGGDKHIPQSHSWLDGVKGFFEKMGF